MAKNKGKKKGGMAAALRALIIVALLLVIAVSVYSAVSSLMGSGESPSPGEATRTEQAQEPSGGGSPQQGASGGGSPGQSAAPKLDEDGSYTSREDVALYLWTYGKLPGNFITKSAAQKKGWEGGSLEKYAPGKSIGGDRFGNYEKLLPEGIKYRECDIDTKGSKSRGEKRIVYAEDCSLIYYTEDHYKSFELLYGEEP
jgi:hypothetical protein